MGSPIESITSSKKKCEGCGQEKPIYYNVFLRQDLCIDCDKKMTVELRKNEPERFLKYLGIPKEYLQCSFENFQGNDILVKGFQRYCSKVQSLLLIGICGCGKTHIVVAVMRELVKQNVSISRMEFKPARKLLQEIKASYDNKIISESEVSILQRYGSKPLLILDDFGFDETPSDWQVNILYSLLDERINQSVKTIITTNLSLEEIEDKFGSRIASRLSGFINLKIKNMPDYRKQKIKQFVEIESN